MVRRPANGWLLGGEQLGERLREVGAVYPVTYHHVRRVVAADAIAEAGAKQADGGGAGRLPHAGNGKADVVEDGRQRQLRLPAFAVPMAAEVEAQRCDARLRQTGGQRVKKPASSRVTPPPWTRTTARSVAASGVTRVPASRKPSSVEPDAIRVLQVDGQASVPDVVLHPELAFGVLTRRKSSPP